MQIEIKLTQDEADQFRDNLYNLVAELKALGCDVKMTIEGAAAADDDDELADDIEDEVQP